MFHNYLLLCCEALALTPVNRFADTCPYRLIRKDFNDATLVGKGA